MEIYCCYNSKALELTIKKKYVFVRVFIYCLHLLFLPKNIESLLSTPAD